MTGIPRLVFKLMLDRRVPLAVKLLPVAGLAYVVMPYDIIRDIPLIGWLDDLIVLVPSILLFLVLAPREVVSEHLRGGRPPGDSGKPGDDAGGSSDHVIDGRYKFLDEDQEPRR